MKSILLASAVLQATHMGSWYPKGKQLDSLLQSAYSSSSTIELNNDRIIRGIIVPHAGYTFCVQTSMNAFRNINPDQYDRVFVLGPSHHMAIRYCTIADATSAESPYGEIPFDIESAQYLLNNYPKLFKKLGRSTAEVEHSLEMEFPLLKYLFKSKPFKIIPIMVGSLTYQQCKDVSEALSQYKNDPKTLFVISSDFCHWGSRFGYQYLPPDNGRNLKVYQRIEELDRKGAEMIATGNPEKFFNYLEETENTICGRNPILIIMNLFEKDGMSATFPAYSQSENIISMSGSSVSYFAGIITVNNESSDEI